MTPWAFVCFRVATAVSARLRSQVWNSARPPGDEMSLVGLYHQYLGLRGSAATFCPWFARIINPIGRRSGQFNVDGNLLDTRWKRSLKTILGDSPCFRKQRAREMCSLPPP